MNKEQLKKVEIALRLAKDCTYADEMTEGSKEYLRNSIDEALEQVEKSVDLAGVIIPICDYEAGTVCDNVNVKKRTGVCRNCGGQFTE